MPSDISGSVAGSSGCPGLAALDSGAGPASPAFAVEDPAVSAVAPSIADDPSTVGANYLLPPSPPAVAVDFFIGRRAPEDFGMGSTGIPSTPGPAFGRSSVLMGGVDSFIRLALHQISLSIAKKRTRI